MDEIIEREHELAARRAQFSKEEQVDLLKWKKKFTLPWIFTYVGWLLALAFIGVSVFFIWAYGIQFGQAKCTKWLSTLIISFIMSVFITQPIKVSIYLTCYHFNKNYINITL